MPVIRARRAVVALLALIVLVWSTNTGCRTDDDRTVVTLWHQMTPAEREVLQEEIGRFQAAHPDIAILALYKETEELRSGFQTAGLAGKGPELVYGPSDAMGPFHTMRLVKDMSPWFSTEEQAKYLDATLVRLPSHDDPSRRVLVQVGDRLGNHLALVYNRHFVSEPPKTTDELIQLAVKNTIDENGDGKIDRYGVVWNYVEPFFAIPFLTGHGAWVFADGEDVRPDLDTAESIAAYRFIRALQDEYRVVPKNCDYETADSLFKSGQAAMIINGDWSWGDYLNQPGIDAAIAVLPIVSSTGLPMRPMVATKGYSLNANADGPSLEASIEFVRYMTSVDVERRFMERLKTLPSRRELLEDPLLTDDPTLRVSYEQMTNGRPMPVVAELRAIWDSMRPHYQAILGGSATPEEAASAMQRDAEAKIGQMNQHSLRLDEQFQGVTPGAAAHVVRAIGGLLIVVCLIWQAKNLVRLARDWRRNRLAYIFVGPALIVILLTIVFPFFYNVVLSLSNMSLRNFKDWQITGFQNYVAVIRDPMFFSVLVKTIVWTVVNVFFHVVLGLILAVSLNGPVVGKSIYRVLLIIPWAVPAYITALTWRGMFDTEYGAINLLTGLQVNWLGDPFNAFVACILTNVWLGFPFMMVIALGGMQGIPQELYEAARIDGASRLKQFRHITLPLLRPVLVPAVTLGAIWTFNNLNVIWLVSNGGQPSDKTHILVSYVYKAVFSLYRYGYGAALSMIIFFILLAFLLVLLRGAKATESAY